MSPRAHIPSNWSATLGDGPLALGYDIATSAKGKANPSSISVIQRQGHISITRLIVAWKTPDPAVARQVISAVLDDIEDRRLKPRRLAIDSSNERYYAADIRSRFASRVSVDLIAGNDAIDYRGERLNAKTLLGNMYVAAIEDGLLTLPAAEWVEADHRLVMREAGGFTTLLGPNGEHGDTFDSGKLAYWSLNHSGVPITSSSVHAIQVGGFNRAPASLPSYTDPIIHHMARRNMRRTFNLPA